MSSVPLTAYISHGVDDLASLPELSENILLHEVFNRYQRNLIYTYIGDMVLAVNPYKDMENSSEAVMSQYCRVESRNSLSPHAFIVSDKAYNNMQLHRTNQCCIVSGESGAGKTESTKLLVQHIVHQCQHQSSDLLQRIVKVNPLLEAFGNARTNMNLNSSRFGKLIELQFNGEGQLQGAQITEYLLEKSRVVQQNAGERNYHIFYYLFAGLGPHKLQINLLKQPEEHRITCPVDGMPVFPDELSFRHCKTMWAEVQDAMKFVGFNGEQYDGVVAILTAVIHISEIKFLHDNDTDGVYIEHENLVEITSMLLGIDKSEDLSGALIVNVAKVRGEEIVSLKNVYQAGDGRDALAKLLYGRLFGWIVRQINCLLQTSMETSAEDVSISILDIYGFENFNQNSFEQLCINAANEELQTFFNKHVFRNEMDAYAGEGIKQSAIKFTDNDSTVKLLFDPSGIFSLIDEESIFPKSTDLTLIEKLSKNIKSPVFQKVKNQPLLFTIQHYAGLVSYNVYGFLEKNRDTLSSNLVDILLQSSSIFVQELFATTIPGSTSGSASGAPNSCRLRERGGLANRKSVILTQPLEFNSTEQKSKLIGAQIHKKTKSAAGSTSGQPVTNLKTIVSHFKVSLKELIAKLTLAEPHFIRCIKPNGDKEPNKFDVELVMKQLRYTGVMETVAIRRQGFAVRLTFHDFIRRELQETRLKEVNTNMVILRCYKIIALPLLSKVHIGPNICNTILAAAGINGYQIGKTKVFLRYYHADQLDALVKRVVNQVVVCQSYMRRFAVRLRYQRAVETYQSYRLECSAFALDVGKYSNVIVDAQRKHVVEDRKRVVNKLKTQHALIANEFKKHLEHQIKFSTPVSPPVTVPVPLPVSTPNGNSVVSRHYEMASAGVSTDIEAVLVSSTSTSEQTQQQDGNKVTSGQSRHPAETVNLQEYLDETISRWSEMSRDFWCKVIYFERCCLVSKTYFAEWTWKVDQSASSLNGKTMGLSSDYMKPFRQNDEIYAIIPLIAQGIMIGRDSDGNIYATKLTNSCDIIVRGCQDSRNCCLSNEIIRASGHLVTNKRTKIYDILKFMKTLQSQLRNGSIDNRSILSMSMISISFTTDDVIDQNIPSWFTLINFCALEKLAQRTVIVELIGTPGSRLSSESERQVQDVLSILPKRKSAFWPGRFPLPS